MRALHNSGKIALTSMLILLAFTINSYARIKMKKVVAQKADYYSLTAQYNGIKISVDPYKEKERLKESFGCDLLSRGILPVLVVVENQNAEDGYILVIENAKLVMADAMTDGNKDNKGWKTNKLERASNRLKYLEIMFAGELGALPVLFWAEKKLGDEFEIKRNLEQKQMVLKTIYQGGSHSGFLYFNLGHKEDLGRVQGVSLSIRNIRTKEISSVTINTAN